MATPGQESLEIALWLSQRLRDKILPVEFGVYYRLKVIEAIQEVADIYGARFIIDSNPDTTVRPVKMAVFNRFKIGAVNRSKIYLDMVIPDNAPRVEVVQVVNEFSYKLIPKAPGWKKVEVGPAITVPRFILIRIGSKPIERLVFNQLYKAFTF